MKLQHYLILLMTIAFLAGFAFKKSPQEKLNQRMQLLTNKTWKVYEVNVSTFTYTDSISTGIEYKFSTSGDCLISTIDGNSGSIPWTFDASLNNIIFNQGTSDEIVYRIMHLNHTDFSYKVTYLVKGQNMEYTYKLK
jgi:hypothetical protein